MALRGMIDGKPVEHLSNDEAEDADINGAR
jgi:hypothetical protein